LISNILSSVRHVAFSQNFCASPCERKVLKRSLQANTFCLLAAFLYLLTASYWFIESAWTLYK